MMSPLPYVITNPVTCCQLTSSCMYTCSLPPPSSALRKVRRQTFIWDIFCEHFLADIPFYSRIRGCFVFQRTDFRLTFPTLEIFVFNKSATRYGLEGPGIQSRSGRNFRDPSISAMEPTEPPINWYLISFPGVKWPGRGVNHSLI
jgi:hypothetical protein